MSRRTPSGWRTWLRPLALVLIALALFGRIGAGALASGLPDPGPGSADPIVAALGVICHAGGPPPGSDGSPSHHRGLDCATCPFCLSLSAPLALLAPPPALPPIRVGVAIPARPLPPARAPPSLVLTTPYPRGPPALT